MKVCPTCGNRFDRSDWLCPACGKMPLVCRGFLAFAPALAEDYAGFETSFFRRLAAVEKGNFWFEARNEILIWAMRRHFPTAARFLEIGCGTGFVLARMRTEFPGLVLSGSEIFPEGLTFAQSRLPGISLLQMDARSIPFSDEFDVIGAFDVLEHIVEDEVVLSQMFCAVKRGGGILLTVPQHPFLWSAADTFSNHQRRYTRADLIRKVRQAGFDVIGVTSFVSLLLPLLLLARLRAKEETENYDRFAEFEMHPFLNGSFRTILDVERAMIRVGFSFPAGGSLLMAARKRA